MNPLSDAKTGDSSRLYSLGRHALLEALRIARVQPRQKVLVPSFICREVLAPLRCVQASPCFYPLDPNLAPQLPPPAPDVAAVLTVNYFGFPQTLDPFREYGARYGACLIEDNAHGFLGSDERGIALGTRGDLGIFSFRKSLAAPDGGALLLNREDWIDRMPPFLRCRDEPLPAQYRLKRSLRHIQNASGIPVRTIAEKTLRSVRRMRTGHALPVSLPVSEFEIPGPAAIHCESARMLERVDASKEVARRRDLYAHFARKLARLEIEALFGQLPTGVAPYGYPFRADERIAAAAIRIAERSGLDCARWPALPSEVSASAPDFYRNVWWVNFLC